MATIFGLEYIPYEEPFVPYSKDIDFEKMELYKDETLQKWVLEYTPTGTNVSFVDGGFFINELEKETTEPSFSFHCRLTTWMIKYLEENYKHLLYGTTD